MRQNSKVREVADHLRAKGFDVIEEGRREPAKDNPVGITLGHLLKWLANPADAFAREDRRRRRRLAAQHRARGSVNIGSRCGKGC